MKIDISDQIYKWRGVIAAHGELPIVKGTGMAAIGIAMAHPVVFEALETVGLAAITHLPAVAFDNPLNPWTRHRAMPEAPAETFRTWFQKTRGHA